MRECFQCGDKLTDGFYTMYAYTSTLGNQGALINKYPAHVRDICYKCMDAILDSESHDSEEPLDDTVAGGTE